MMTQLLSFLPTVAFFIFYKLYDIFVASGALIVTSALVLVVSYLIYRKVGKILLANFAIVTVFGTLTIFLQNPDLIKWKVTIIYILFTLVLLFSHWFMKQPMIQKMLGNELQLPKLAWRRLNVAWAVFFFSCGIANIYVAFWLSQDTWVSFKVFGLSALTLLFTIMSGMYIYCLKLQGKK